jgi:hypothetical protein
MPSPYRPRFQSIWPRVRGVHAFGFRPGAASNYAEHAVRTPGGARWSGDHGPHFGWSTGFHRLFEGDGELWSLDYDGLSRLYPDNAILAPKMPSLRGQNVRHFRIGRGFASAWLLVDWTLYQYTGLRWRATELPAPGEATGCGALDVTSSWIDETGQVWAVVKTGNDDPSFILHWNGQSWSTPPVPADFQSHLVRGRSSKDLWFFGKGKVWHWNGRGLRTLAAPLDSVTTVWLPDRGGPWFGGTRPGDAGAGVCRVERQAEGDTP